MTRTDPNRRGKTLRVFLAISLLAGLGLRLLGVQFGAPLVVHPDEHDLLLHAMEAGAQKGNPNWFEYPSAMIYFTLALQGVRYLISGAENPNEYWTAYASDPFPFHLWVRVAVACIGTLGVYALFLLGKEWDRRRPTMRVLGLGSALLLAVHFLHVRDSHFAAVDIPLTTAITFVLWLLMREMHRKETNIRRVILMALAVGLCCGINYTAIALIFPLFYLGLANVIRGDEVRIGIPWLLGSAMCLLAAVGLGFLITTPYAVIDSARFWEDLRYHWVSATSRMAIYGGGEPFIWGYLRGPWMWGGGRVLGLLAFFGFMMAALRREREDCLLLWFAVPYFLLIALGDRVWGCWFLPLVPLQILWAVRFIAVYADHIWFAQVMTLKPRRVLVWTSLIGVGSTSLFPSIRLDVLLRENDTRVEASQRIEKSMTAADYPLVTAFLPPLPREIPRKRENGLLNYRESFELGEVHRLEIEPMEDLIEEGVNQVLFSSFYWGAVQQSHVGRDYPGVSSYVEFLENLKLYGKEEWRISAAAGGMDFHAENIYAPTFHLWRWQRPGPEVRLYSLPLALNE